MTSTSRFDRLIALRREAAKEFNLAEGHERVGHIAGLRLQHEALLERLCAGEAINSTELVLITKTIAELTPPLNQTVKVEIVEPPPRPPHKCPACNWEGTADEPKVSAPAAKDAAKVVDLPKKPKEPPKKPDLGYVPATPFGEGVSVVRNYSHPAQHDGQSGGQCWLGGFSADTKPGGLPKWPDPGRNR
jgi:hypothetical protein